VGIIEIALIGIGLGADAFAVAICKGLSMAKMKWENALIIGLYFGLFQAIMPLIGFFLGVGFEGIIENVSHWITFILLGLIGVKMIYEAIKQGTEEVNNDKVNFKTMLPLAIATSIDALAAGVTFAFLSVNILMAIAIIGVITLALSITGVKIGNVFGEKFRKHAGVLGGVILILIGLRILIINI